MAEESHSVFQNFASEPERYLKLFPLGLGTIYIVGFLVVALELAGYGTSPLELVKIQYLAAGFWCGLVVLTYYGLTTLFRSLYSELISNTVLGSVDYSKKKQKKKKKHVLLSALVSCATPPLAAAYPGTVMPP